MKTACYILGMLILGVTFWACLAALHSVPYNGMRLDTYNVAGVMAWVCAAAAGAIIWSRP